MLLAYNFTHVVFDLVNIIDIMNSFFMLLHKSRNNPRKILMIRLKNNEND